MPAHHFILILSETFKNKPIFYSIYILTHKRVEHEREAKRGAAKACKGSNNKR